MVDVNPEDVIHAFLHVPMFDSKKHKTKPGNMEAQNKAFLGNLQEIWRILFVQA